MAWLIAAACSGALAVSAGALGSHALAESLPGELLAGWNTAVLYHLVHSLGLLALALYGVASGRSIQLPAGLFAAGIALFSGSLYAIALTRQAVFGPLTPLGGLFLIAGWLSLLTLARGARVAR